MDVSEALIGQMECYWPTTRSRPFRVPTLWLLANHSVTYFRCGPVLWRQPWKSHKQTHVDEAWTTHGRAVGLPKQHSFCIFLGCGQLLFIAHTITGGHRTRVAVVTLDNMAETRSPLRQLLPQILTVSVRYCGPAFMSWLPMLWDTLTRKPELQWFGISPQFRLKVSRGDEGVGHVCFPGDEGVGQPWRGYRRVQMNVGPA